MKRIVFLTGEDMLDVDMPIVKELNLNSNEHFKITWVVVLRGYGWFYKNDIITFCEQNQINHIVLEQIGKLKNPLTILFYTSLLKKIKDIDPDIIYDSYLGVPYMHFLRSFFLKKKLFVMSIHDVVQHYKMKNKLIRTLYYNYLMSTYLNFHIFSNNQLKIFNEKFKGKNSFHTPLYLKNFGEVEKSVSSKSKKVTNFLFFGIIRPNKGLDLLINAANELGKKYNNFQITVAGKCDNWDDYAQLIKRPEHFNLMIGNIEKEVVPELLTSNHFLILPYRDVTQSGVLLTSYNYNVPVIASKLEWFEEYITDEQNGYLFENGNSTALYTQMEKALLLTDEEYQSMADNLKVFISQNIDIKSITNKYINFFQSVNS